MLSDRRKPHFLNPSLKSSFFSSYFLITQSTNTSIFLNSAVFCTNPPSPSPSPKAATISNLEYILSDSVLCTYMQAQIL